MAAVVFSDPRRLAYGCVWFRADPKEGPAIAVGALLSRRLPGRAVKYGAAALFVIFGIRLVLGGDGAF